MADKASAQNGRARHWLIDAVVGGGLALGLITVAHASLPTVAPVARSAPRPPPRAAAVVVPQAPPVLIAFTSPLPGYAVDSPFGLRQLPWEEQGRLHAGVDIAAPAGQPILAAADGVVVRTGQDPGYGRFVAVKHAEGLTTLYGHMSAYAPGLAAGHAVKAGDVLGQIGSTGASTGAHLHFEIRDAHDRPMNPELFLDRSFAQADDLPLKQALRAPRIVRVAYVSNIPRSKRDQMAALQAAKAAGDAAAVPANATDMGIDAHVTVAADGRPHARFNF